MRKDRVLRPQIVIERGGEDAGIGHELATYAWLHQIKGTSVDDCAAMLTEDIVGIAINGGLRIGTETLYGAILHLLETCRRPTQADLADSNRSEGLQQ